VAGPLHRSTRRGGGDYCRGRSLDFADCIYVTGPVALELAVALYGWDAPTGLMSANRLGTATAKVSTSEAFERAYGDIFDLFSSYTDAFFYDTSRTDLHSRRASSSDSPPCSVPSIIYDLYVLSDNPGTVRVNRYRDT